MIRDDEGHLVDPLLPEERFRRAMQEAVRVFVPSAGVVFLPQDDRQFTRQFTVAVIFQGSAHISESSLSRPPRDVDEMGRIEGDRLGQDLRDYILKEVG